MLDEDEGVHERDGGVGGVSARRDDGEGEGARERRLGGARDGARGRRDGEGVAVSVSAVHTRTSVVGEVHASKEVVSTSSTSEAMEYRFGTTCMGGGDPVVSVACMMATRMTK